MSKKFIIACTEPLTEKRNAVSKFLETKGGYWHWLPDFWIFIPNNPAEYDADSLAQAVHRRVGANVSLLVLDVDVPPGGSWQGFASKDENWKEWLQQNWRR